MFYIGVDPGLDGAVAILNATGSLCVIRDTPTLTIGGPRGKRREYNLRLMSTLFPPAEECVVFIERVHSMPGQGVRSMWTMGFGSGAWLGILSALGIKYELVTPQRWQKVMLDGQGKGKDATRGQAMALFPSVAGQLNRKKDHGRADALLIAEYGLRSRCVILG